MEVTMQIKDLIPWNRKGSEIAQRDESEHRLFGLQREMNRAFDNFWRSFDKPFAALDGTFEPRLPRTDVVETNKAVEVSVELPGMDEKDIDVSVTKDALTIKGESKLERDESRRGHYLSERFHGSFYRTVPLPPGVLIDGAEAKLKKGVLTITLPKSPEAAAKAKKIEIKGG
jgi:HSP20 family protein